MPRYRLRFHATEIDLPPGEVVIGRALESFIRLDDAMVSRRHAMLEVGAKGVVVSDLGSRNGVQVNGQRISRPTPVNPGDVIRVGHEEFVVLAPGATRSGATSTGGTRQSLCGSCGCSVSPGVTPCPNCGRPISQSRPTTLTDVKPTSSQGALAVLTAVGDKALAMGRLEEAERILGGSLRDIELRVSRGHRPDRDQMDPALQRALSLARETGKTEWFRWIFVVAGAIQMVLPRTAVDDLHMLMFQYRPQVDRELDAYLRNVKARPDDEEGTFQLKRIAALRRYCGEGGG